MRNWWRPWRSFKEPHQSETGLAIVEREYQSPSSSNILAKTFELRPNILRTNKAFIFLVIFDLAENPVALHVFVGQILRRWFAFIPIFSIPHWAASSKSWKIQVKFVWMIRGAKVRRNQMSLKLFDETKFKVDRMFDWFEFLCHNQKKEYFWIDQWCKEF